MCGRFYMDGEADEREVFPIEGVKVVCADGERTLRWGFANPAGKGVLINARAETAAVKPTFRDCLASRRCLVPAQGFYEWRHEAGRKKKERFRVARADGRPLMMAGLYDEAGRFVIVTQPANAAVAPLHDRMPVILPTAELQALWLSRDSLAQTILESRPDVELTVRPG